MTTTRGGAPQAPQEAPPEVYARGGDAAGRQALLRRGVLVMFGLGTLLSLLIVQLSADGWLLSVDRQAHWLGLENRWTSTWIVMKVLETFGQRGPTAVEAFLVVGWIAWRGRTWRPVLLLGGSLLALNFAVGVMKLFFSRGKPALGDPELFTSGMMFPSGHAGNTVLTWAIVGYIIARYAGVRRPRAWLAGTTVVTPLVCVVVAVASVYFDSHWVSDLVGGWLIGGMVLQAVVLVDQWVEPRHAEAAVGWTYAALQRLRARVRGPEPIRPRT